MKTQALKKLAILAGAGIIVSSLSGCAGIHAYDGFVGFDRKKPKYEQDKSRALNLMNAGAEYGETISLRDTKTGKKMDRRSFASLFTLGGSLVGLQLGGSMFDAAAGAATASTYHYVSDHPILVMWQPAIKKMPEDSAKQKKALLDAMREADQEVSKAIEQTAQNLGLKLGPKTPNSKSKLVRDMGGKRFEYGVYTWTVKGNGCTPKTCWIVERITYPDYNTGAPDFLKDKVEEPFWEYSAKQFREWQTMVFFYAKAKKKGELYPTKKFYEELSKNIKYPNFIYMPPGYVSDESHTVLKYPVVFERGEMLLFKKPEKNK